MASSLEHVAIVTGGNKGVGLAIVRGLCKKAKGYVILAARNEELGLAAVETLEKEGLQCHFEQLDICSAESISKFKERVEKKYGGIDLLVSNAGIAYKVASTAPNLEKSQVTLATNYFGTINTIQALLPLIRTNGKIVNVSSFVGKATGCLGPDVNHPVRKRYVDPNQTVEGVTQLVNEYLLAVEKDDYSVWPQDKAYSLSKLSLSSFTAALARSLSKDPRNMRVNSCCPGYVDTDMTSHKGHLTPDEGAETPLFVCDLNDSSLDGAFFSKKAVNDWTL